MKKELLILCTAVVLMFCLKTTASALTVMEILVDKLVEKNILTQAEGDKILRETKEEAKKQKEETKKAVAKELRFRLTPAHENHSWNAETRHAGARVWAEHGPLSLAERKNKERVRLHGFQSGGTQHLLSCKELLGY